MNPSPFVPPPRRALLSVSDKSGLVDLANALIEAGFELCSTGGTARFLQDNAIAVTDVARITGFPEIMDGRVKTLHPKIFGGILARRDRQDDQQALADLELPLFDFVVVNLYPFRETVARPESGVADAIENIDIGGPSLIRAAAKNHAWVTVLTSPRQYPQVIAELNSHRQTSHSLRRRLMVEAFSHTASYDAAIQEHFARVMNEDLDASEQVFANTLTLSLQRTELLRYGENPHQLAAVYRMGASPGVVGARQLNGKPLSYNNLLDLDAATGIVNRLDGPAVAVIKHNNPCGAALRQTLADATEAAFAGDPVSAFGSVVGMNRRVDEETARWLCQTSGLFVEALIAPAFDPEAIRLLTTVPKWKANVRLLEGGGPVSGDPVPEYRSIAGGMLVQQGDTGPDPVDAWKMASGGELPDTLLAELRFAWAIVRAVKSNAITLSRDCALAGVGAGQMSRIDSVRIAIEKAGDRAKGSILASDAFFPFPDSVQLAAGAGIAAIVQPGGSLRDGEVIEAARKAGIPMVLTGRRHFRH